MALVPVMASCAMAEDRSPEADVGKLTNPETRIAEISRLLDCNDSKFLTRYRFHIGAQKNSPELLLILATDTEYDFQRRSPGYPKRYSIPRPEELFGPEATDGLFGGMEPSLSRIKEANLLVFDSKGKLLESGEDYLKDAYFYDFNRDGIFEVAEVSEEDGASLFTLKTIESKPRILLQVAFNRHPANTELTDRWRYECFDENGDGILEVAFGPESAESDKEARHFVIRWDESAAAFSSNNIPDGSPVAILGEGQSLEDLLTTGKMSYAQFREDDDEPIKVRGDLPTREPYSFISLKQSSSEDISSFFDGRNRLEFYDIKGAVPNRLPEDFWAMTAKAAALAFADHNRTAAHRRKTRLVIDDRNEVEPPEEGWYLYQWTSSGCYSLSSQCYALRFTTSGSWLLATDFNTNGAVGRNAFADQPAHTMRVIPLGTDEARFLADVIYWLNRIRSYDPEAKRDAMFGGHSTADGTGTIYQISHDNPAKELAGDTVWASGYISNNWRGDYSPEIFVNLIHHLLAVELPGHLKERWKTGPEIDRRNLVTPIEERLQPRLGENARRKLEENARTVFEKHWSDNVPTLALADVIDAIGQEALTGLQAELERLNKSFPDQNKEDQEFEALSKRFGFDHFGNTSRDEPSEHPEAWNRYRQLEEKRRFASGPALRDSVARTLHKLHIAGNATLLKQEINKPRGDSRWAMDQLRRNFPWEWEAIMIGKFREGDLATRLDLFNTLAAARPAAAKSLVEMMNPREQADLLIEIAAFETEAGEGTGRIPALIEILRGRKDPIQRRSSAMRLLPEMKCSKEQCDELIGLLLYEIENPQTGEFKGHDTLATALDALSRLPGARDHLDTIQSTKGRDFRDFRVGLDSLIRLTEEQPDREERLTEFIRPRLKEHSGMMNEVFLAILALDLRNLAAEVAGFATASPLEEDGDGANYSGGRFKGPSGNRYHIAREITALWNESDPLTLGRMWIAFAVHRPYDFDLSDNDGEIARILCKKASVAVAPLAREVREAEAQASFYDLPHRYAKKTAAEMTERLFEVKLPQD